MRGITTMRLSPGFGTVRLIDRNRRNPYAVHPPTVKGKRPKAICYVPDRETGIAVLKLYHEGRYRPESDVRMVRVEEETGRRSCTFQEVYRLYWEHRFGESAVKELKKASRTAMRSAWLKLENLWNRKMDDVTIMELQEIVNETSKDYSKTTVTRLVGLIKGLYRYAVPRELCRKEYGLYVEMPKTKDEKHHDSFTDEEIAILWRAAVAGTGAGEDRVDRAETCAGGEGGPAYPHNAVDENGTDRAETGAGGEGNAAYPCDNAGGDWTDRAETCASGEGNAAYPHNAADEDGAEREEPRAGLKGNVDSETTAIVRMILTMIYSGYRIGAWDAHDGYEGMRVDFENGIFIGGVKTEAGKNRVVPIHSAILPLVMEIDGKWLCEKKAARFRKDMVCVLKTLGIRALTPHSCRHTFHRLLEKAGVNEVDRKRLMGHSLKGDITNGVYGHRGIEELRREIEKIDVADYPEAMARI